MTKDMQTVPFPQQWLNEINRCKKVDGECFFRLVVHKGNEIKIEFNEFDLLGQRLRPLSESI